MISREELDIIRENERISQIDAKRIDERFIKLLDEYLCAQDLNLKTSSVPADGSCLYHAILESFEAKYSYALENTHQNMRIRVAQYLLKHIDDDLELLEKFRTDEPSFVQNSKSSTITSTSSLKNRYKIFCNRHMHETTDWPIEVCILAVTKIYRLKITILAENLLVDGKPAGYIFERFTSTVCDNNCETEEVNSITIGNRWNQHYYSTIPKNINNGVPYKTKTHLDIIKETNTENHRKRRATERFLSTLSPEAHAAFTEGKNAMNKRRREAIITPERKEEIRVANT